MGTVAFVCTVHTILSLGCVLELEEEVAASHMLHIRGLHCSSCIEFVSLRKRKISVLELNKKCYPLPIACLLEPNGMDFSDTRPWEKWQC